MVKGQNSCGKANLSQLISVMSTGNNCRQKPAQCTPGAPLIKCINSVTAHTTQTKVVQLQLDELNGTHALGMSGMEALIKRPHVKKNTDPVNNNALFFFINQ